MRFVFFTHSLVSDWNHGNAHFQRGVMSELVSRGHEAIAYEPADGWSRRNLIADRGEAAVADFHRRFPELKAETYGPAPDPAAMLDRADVVIVHEWTDPDLVAGLGAARRAGAPYTLLFHDTHHRTVSAGTDISGIDLDGYDGVLAFGEVLSELYRRQGWGRQVFTWHEAADTRVFRPHPEIVPRRDLVWVGNWGDGERSDTLRAYLLEPVRRLCLAATIHGVRYPADALSELGDAGIDYRGWLANVDVPEVFARHRATVHVPRRPYVEQLPGIPTIRVFEALACGIALVCAPWDDVEGLFRAGEDYLTATSPDAMTSQLARVLADQELARELRLSGLARILSRHTCAHRVDELFTILAGLRATDSPSFEHRAAAE